MSSLVLDLQQDAMNSSVLVSQLLRKALAVASKLDVGEFRAWVEKELNGYNDEPKPAYREIHGQIKAFNPYNGYIPVIIQNTQTAAKLSSTHLGQPVSELEDLLLRGKPDQELIINFPYDILQKVFSDALAYQLIPGLMIGRSQIAGILDAVRNIVLEWSLKLEKEGILGEDLRFSQREKEAASTITYNINSFSGVLGNVTGHTVQIGDYAAIHNQLKELGVSQEERNELENILDKLKSAKGPEKQSLIKRIGEWVQKNGPVIGTLSETIRGWVQGAS